MAQVVVTCAGPISTVLNCGNPCTNQTIDLESVGLKTGNVYTVRLRETNAAWLVGKALCCPHYGLKTRSRRSHGTEHLLFQPTGARALFGE